MKYTNEVVISLLLQKVIKLFDNPVNFSKGHPGFISIELLSDTPGKREQNLVFDTE